MLIVLRGNSGSGKSITAKTLRDVALQTNQNLKIALVEQDYLRRNVLKEKEAERGDNIDLIRQTATYALGKGYITILEGILYSTRYEKMLKELSQLAPIKHFYYFDISLEETLRRHKTKPIAHEVSEQDIRSWYKEKDLLGFIKETTVPEYLSLEKIVQKIIKETSLDRLLEEGK